MGTCRSSSYLTVSICMCSSMGFTNWKTDLQVKLVHMPGDIQNHCGSHSFPGTSCGHKCFCLGFPWYLVTSSLWGGPGFNQKPEYGKVPPTSQRCWVPLRLSSSGNKSSCGGRGRSPHSKLSKNGLMEAEVAEGHVAAPLSTSFHKVGTGRVYITGVGKLGECGEGQGPPRHRRCPECNTGLWGLRSWSPVMRRKKTGGKLHSNIRVFSVTLTSGNKGLR